MRALTMIAVIALLALMVVAFPLGCGGSSDSSGTPGGTGDSGSGDDGPGNPSGDDTHTDDTTGDDTTGDDTHIDDTTGDDTTGDDTGGDDTGDDDDTGVTPCENAGLPLSLISLPAGFKICIFAANVPAARSLTLGANGTVFIGTRGDRVYAVRDEDGDHVAEKTYTLLSGLNQPNGVEFKDGSLYVGEISRITRYDDIENHLDAPPAAVVVNDNYPTDAHHGWKYIRFGPDGRLYVPVGAPCNVCEKADERYGSITSIAADGTDMEIVAHGVRNTVGFAWHPDTHELWFTDNGRDNLGDDIPSDELNRVATAGAHFGFPYCQQGDIVDPDFGAGHNCADYTPPALKLGAHVAALGMRFYQGTQFPSPYAKSIFIAQHGSWNRSSKVGYRVMNVRLSGNTISAYEPFATGWLQGEQYWGRPVDVLPMPDGSLLVSDDFAGVIYRISYS